MIEVFSFSLDFTLLFALWFIIDSSSIYMLILFADKYSSQFGGGSQYAYFHEEDETSFQLVDTAKTQKTAYQRNRMRFAQVRPIITEWGGWDVLGLQ